LTVRHAPWPVPWPQYSASCLGRTRWSDPRWRCSGLSASGLLCWEVRGGTVSRRYCTLRNAPAKKTSGFSVGETCI
jgi:hypothetical protein